MSQIGARSNMLGAAVVGSVRDNSSIFYNPGGMPFAPQPDKTRLIFGPLFLFGSCFCPKIIRKLELEYGV